MNLRGFSYALVATASLVSTGFQPCVAQTAQSLNPQSAAPLAASASTAVPALVPFSGFIAEADGKPVSGETAITFLIFKDQEGGAPLFAETQAVTPDASGHYKIQLGATLANGLPTDLFSTGEARWLEVQAAGQTPQPRVLIASVPYALKAADSATLGGLPASAFVLAGSKTSADLVAVPAATTTASTVTTTGGTAGYIPEFTGASTIADSPIFLSGTNVGIDTTTPTANLDVNGSELISGALTANGGVNIGSIMEMTPTGTATATTGFNSQTFKLYTSAYNSTSKALLNPRFEWQAEVISNDTASPSATLNLLSSTTSAGAAETGFHFNANGTINFAKGQTFPGTGNGTITAITAGTGLTGGGRSGNVTLAIDSTKVVSAVTAGAGLTGGGAGGNLKLAVDPTQVPLLGGSNTFAGNMTVGGQIIAGNGNVAGGIVFPVSQNRLGPSGVFGSTSYPLDMQATANSLTGLIVPQDFRLLVEPGALSGSSSLSLQYAASGGSLGETGISFNPNGTITGVKLSLSEPAGTQATPVLTVQADENGVSRNAASQLVVEGSTYPGDQLLMGYVTDPANGLPGGYATIQATVTGVFNSALMLQPNGGCVCIATGNTQPYANPLIIGQGQGDGLADGWATYSSRRFKTNIQTLPDALNKVEKLRGVSYTLKANGKHEIGVIAEEVGAVVPEVVTWEANGKDAQSVDYTRLTALLIEATKEQQTLIQQQQKQIKAQQAQIRNQQTAARLQQTQIARLASQMRTVQAALKGSDRAGSQARTVAQLTMTR